MEHNRRMNHASGRTDRAQRLIDAPLTDTFAALINLDALLQWLPPQGMRGEFEHFDARVGGSFRMRLTHLNPPPSGGKTDRNSDVVEARFVEIAPNNRVVQAVEFQSEDPRFAGTMTMTWSVTPAEAGTEVVMIADNVPPGISAEDHQEGLHSSLANLAAYLDG